MNVERVNPFETLESLDDFQPKSKPADVPSKRDIDALSQVTGFPSRQVKEHRPARRYTTGRNRQLNLKVTDEAAERFYALADEMAVPLGEVFDQAVKLLDASRKAE
jgi:hypothetical protein